MKQQQLYKIMEVAAILGVGRFTIYEYKKAEWLKPSHSTHGRSGTGHPRYDERAIVECRRCMNVLSGETLSVSFERPAVSGRTT